ncbi:ParB N-terminal domain-containing protein [Humibacter ginsenosidimutans]|uniref:Chromosome partitioning protein ParB n=1 Tax=Humibacter ginsenosidimutans TaxID=2599293 RepID=A0A5B8M0J5_9MICO|nr:ParB N-terminal domain-containing protein [Humibacter ginsenosidimutans]QDZ14197.1 chromosome partitioning protein ParB [Humibacter ginsenosidimutans]
MSVPVGMVELERTVDSIIVGRRHRADLGDIPALAASIEQEGLLQPLTITPDGVLVCGRRRLAAIVLLGWRTVNLWVRSGISDRLGQLVAERDDNLLHKPLTAREQAALYEELKQVMAEDAARRKASTQFTAEHQPGTDGPANLAGPSTRQLGPSVGQLGTAREQAARMVTGRASYTTLERIRHLERIATDPSWPEELRQQATEALERIDAGEPVFSHYQAIADASGQEAEDGTRNVSGFVDDEPFTGDPDEDLAEEAKWALARAVQHGTRARGRRPTGLPSGREDMPTRWPVRAFVQTWAELDGWWLHYDPDELALVLTDEQAEEFLGTAEGTSGFAVRLRTARISQPTPDAERAADAAGERRSLRAL